MHLPKLPKLAKVTKLITANKTTIFAVTIGAMIAVPTTLYINERQKTNERNEATSTTQEPTVETSNSLSVKPIGTNDTATPPTEQQQASPQNTTSRNTPQSSNTATNPTSPSSSPTEPTQKAPYTFTFSSGNRTASWYAGGTYFPPSNGYTDEWASITGKADATGFLNWRLSFNCSSGSACPTMLLQGSNDGASWINYKTLSSTTGTITYPVLYPYYRLLLASGQCSSNACPPPTPPFPITYELSASGYFYYN